MKVGNVVDLNRKFIFVTSAYPGSLHDSTRLKENKDKIESCITEEDCVVLDSAFKGMETFFGKGTWLIKKHAVRNSPLSEEEEQFNKIAESVRHNIELAHGEVKARFRVVCEPFRGERAWLSPIWRFCCALHNLILDYRNNPTEFSSQWQGPLGNIDAKIPKKKVHLHPEMAMLLLRLISQRAKPVEEEPLESIHTSQSPQPPEKPVSQLRKKTQRKKK